MQHPGRDHSGADILCWTEGSWNLQWVELCPRLPHHQGSEPRSHNKPRNSEGHQQPPEAREA